MLTPLDMILKQPEFERLTRNPQHEDSPRDKFKLGAQAFSAPALTVRSAAKYWVSALDELGKALARAPEKYLTNNCL